MFCRAIAARARRPHPHLRRGGGRGGGGDACAGARHRRSDVGAVARIVRIRCGQSLHGDRKLVERARRQRHARPHLRRLSHGQFRRADRGAMVLHGGTARNRHAVYRGGRVLCGVPDPGGLDQAAAAKTSGGADASALAAVPGDAGGSGGLHRGGFRQRIDMDVSSGLCAEHRVAPRARWPR